jgi:hypothetical protein
MQWINVSADVADQIGFMLPEIKKPQLAYIRLRTELQIQQIFELVEIIRIGKWRVLTGTQWSVYIMMAGLPVKKASAEEAFYLPVHVLPEDSHQMLNLHLDAKMASNPEISAKLRIAEPPELVILPNSGDEQFPELTGWYVSSPHLAAVREDAKNLFELDLKHVPVGVPVSQLVFYGHINSQTWIKKGELWEGEQKVAEFRHPTQLTVLDKEIHKMNVPNMPVFTWTFQNWKEAGQANARVFKTTPKLILWLDPKVMPKDAKIQVWCLAGLSQ